MNQPENGKRDFTAQLEQYAETENRGALASLRRGLGKRPGEAPEMFPYIVPWVPDNARGWTEEVYYIVASLFALNPVSWAGSANGDSNLGASLAVLRNSDPQGSDSVDRRFVALLNAHREDLSEHLRAVVGLCAGGEAPVGINWRVLLHDLILWDSPYRTAQRAWARAYWRSRASEDDPDREPNSEE